MPQIVTIASNATVAKLHQPSRELKLAAQAILSYGADNLHSSALTKPANWSGASSFLDFRTGVFPAGFVHYLSAKLRRQGYEVRHVKKPLPTPFGPELPVIDRFGYEGRYDYQPEVVRRLRKHGQIIAQVATGGGKSRIARMAFASLNLPTLFLTTRSLLMYQMRDTFEQDLGVPVSVLGDGQFGHTMVKDGVETQAIKKMSVGMVQTLIARLEEKTIGGEVKRMADAGINREMKEITLLRQQLEAKQTPKPDIRRRLKEVESRQNANRMSISDMTTIAKAKVDQHMRERAQTIQLLSLFSFVILEEAHEASGNSYYEILRHCKNAHYRLALTATPFMKESEEANMRLMACAGPIAIRVTEQMLIDRGILAQPHFRIVPLKVKPPKLHRLTPWQTAYRIGIVENEERNAKVVQECVRAAQYRLSTMVLIQHTRHGDILLALLQKQDLRVEYIQGEDDHAGRKAALRRLAQGEIDVLIGTTILDVGVDVPAVGMVILAGGGKAEVALRQRIGRGLREKKTGPNIALIVDFADNFNDYLKLHARQRLAIIKGTPGFDRNVLEDGADFDFSALYPMQKIPTVCQRQENRATPPANRLYEWPCC